MDQSSEQSADRSMEQDDGRWLTYPELAAVRGIDKPSAIRLATRKKWRRQRDNRRVVRVLVPTEWLSPRYQTMDQPMDRDMDQSGDRADFAAALAAVQAAHAGEVAALHGQVAGLKTLVDRTMDQLAVANTRADRAEQAIAGERSRADAAETRAEAAQSEAGEARQHAREAQQRAEALRREVEAAQIARADAEADVEELHQADATRKARGRWARLRTAWRGE